MNVSGKVVIITGAGSGIGRATALRMAQGQASVGLLGRNRAELDEVAEQLHRFGGEFLVVEADISQAEDVEAAFAQIAERWSGIDVLFANAGINGVWAPIEKLTPVEWSNTIAVNLTGTFLTIKFAVPLMKHHGGSIIVCSSINGTRVFSNSGATAYACSKAGQLALAKMLALELAAHKIRVNVICPGAIDTPIHGKTEKRDTEEVQEPVDFPEGNIPLTDGNVGTPEEVAQLVCFLASDAAAFITGTPIWIDGGQSLLQG